MTGAGDRVLSGFLEEVRASTVRLGGICWYQRFTQSLAPEDVAELDAALADESVRTSDIAKVLNRRGIRLNDTGIRRHRRGDCQCPR